MQKILYNEKKISYTLSNSRLRLWLLGNYGNDADQNTCMSCELIKSPRLTARRMGTRFSKKNKKHTIIVLLWHLDNR